MLLDITQTKPRQSDFEILNRISGDPQAMAQLQSHKAILREAGIEELSSLGVLRLGGIQAVRNGILTPETASRAGDNVIVSKAYRLFDGGRKVKDVVDCLAELKPTLQLRIPLDQAYWAASEIVLEPNTIVVLSRRQQYLTIICEKLTVGDNVTFTWDRDDLRAPGTVPPPRPQITDFRVQTPYKFDPPKAYTAWNHEQGRRVLDGSLGAQGRDGYDGGKGFDGAHAPNMTFWLMELSGSPMFDLNGEEGQDGGRGERGQDGQDGDDGLDSHSIIIDCKWGPGSGGRGGDGGNGGQGGNGGNGGNGGKLALYAPKDVLLQYISNFYVTANGGYGGRQGQGGERGSGGRGGKRGEVNWPCTNMERIDGKDGSEGSGGLNGKDGEKGDFYPDAFSFKPISRDDFNRELTKPAIIKVEPPVASAGDEVAVIGLRFTPSDSVLVEGVVTETRYQSAERLFFKVPPVLGGRRKVEVRQLDSTLSNSATLAIKPVLQRIEPEGRIKPGSIVTLIGGGFVPGCRVMVNGADAPEVQFIDGGRLMCCIVRPFELPPNPAGEPIRIKIILPDGSLETPEKDAILDTYRILAMGDSVVWGQGLREEEKFYSLVADQIAKRVEYSGKNRIGIYKSLLAHSGARIGIRDDGVRDDTLMQSLPGEVPTPYPTILQQCDAFNDAPETIDLIILNGGINDVNVDRILTVLSLDELRRLTKIHCHNHMKVLLQNVVKKFPSARVVVTGYYPLVSEFSDTDFLSPFLAGLGLTAASLINIGLGEVVKRGLGAAVGIVLSDVVRNKLIENCRVFTEQSKTSLQLAIDEVNTTLGRIPRITFTDSRFRSEHAALARNSRLYGINPDLTPQDGLVRDGRATACKNCDDREPDRIDLVVCTLASLGHPTPSGARAYATEIMRDIFPFQAEFKGYADLHTHPMAHLAFGGNLVAGQPDGAVDEALKWCTEKHGPGGIGLGGKAASVFMSWFEGSKYMGHLVGGYPQFDGWPRYYSLIHQHMYVDWIRRSWEGGLRLMCAAAVNNPLLASEFGGSYTDDVTAINLQIKAMKEFVARQSSWMEIALTPDDARRIISGNKLAMVLAIEVEALGNFVHESDCTAEQIRAELKRVYDMGVRMITPIHLINNAFGHTEIKGEVFNILNRFMKGEGDYFEVDDGGEEGVEFRLGEEGNNPIVMFYKGVGNVIPGVGFYQPPTYDQSLTGHINKYGLTEKGKMLIEEMMRLGMLIDVDHMSIKTFNDTLAIAEQKRYPIVATHSVFRELAWKRGETSDIEKLPCEKHKSRKQIERIRGVGGMVAPILSQVDVRQFDDRIPNDCAGSSKSFAQAYLYAVKHMGGRGVAIGSDANGFGRLPCSRFGPHAASRLLGEHNDSVRGRLRDDQVRAQSNGVTYDEPPSMYREPRWESGFAETAYKGEQQDLWEAIFLGLSDTDISSANLGHLGRSEWTVRWIRNIALGIHEEDVHRLPSTNIVDTVLNFNAGVVSRGAWYAKSVTDFSNVPSPDGGNSEIRKVYDKVRPVWEMVQRMNGDNPPYQRCMCGDRDFDINVDGMAHYGLLPDFLRDLKNIGLTDEDLAPLMRSAQDFVDMWDTCVKRAAGPAARGDNMKSGEVLTAGEFIASANGQYTFVYQKDGNLVLYRNRDKRPLWDSKTWGTQTGSCIMQEDGNLVIYDSVQAIWSSDTWQHPGSRLVVQNDGNVVILRPDGTSVWATNTVQRIFPTGPTAKGYEMQPGEVLNPGDRISSANGQYTFIYQGDGNLVLYRHKDGRPLWATHTDGKPTGVCIMQGDGNLVIYDSDVNLIWSSDTGQHSGSRLVVQNDGNVVICRPDGKSVWATNTVQKVSAQGDDMQPGEVLNPGESISSASGQYTFIYQDDGNLVLYRQDGQPLWASKTDGKPTGVCIMQEDGNLVIYDSVQAIWSSNTWQHPGSRLVVQDDGNVVIYSSDETPVWATNTVQP